MDECSVLDKSKTHDIKYMIKKTLKDQIKNSANSYTAKILLSSTQRFKKNKTTSVVIGQDTWPSSGHLLWSDTTPTLQAKKHVRLLGSSSS